MESQAALAISCSSLHCTDNNHLSLTLKSESDYDLKLVRVILFASRACSYCCLTSSENRFLCLKCLFLYVFYLDLFIIYCRRVVEILIVQILNTDCSSTRVCLN